MSARKKISFFLLVFLSFIFITSPTIVTAQVPSSPSPLNWHAEEQTNFTGNNLINMIVCFLTGLPFSAKGCVVPVFTQSGPPSTKITYNGEGGGALGATTGLLAQVYDNPPVSGTQYLANAVMDGLGLQKPAYAQVTGSGAGVLQPVQKLWEFFRNIAYTGFIIVFLIVGFMIMLRQRINPQTVVSIQQALPGLVIGLIMVTFSYFIAGLFVDMSFLLSQFAGVLFISQIGNSSDASRDISNLLNNWNFISMIGNFILQGRLWDAAGQIGNGINQIVFPGVPGMAMRGLIGALAACFSPIGVAGVVAGGAVGIGLCSLIGAGAGAFGGGVIISGIVLLILLIGLLQAIIRLVFALIMAYVQIIVATIFGPILILVSAIPGRGSTLALWWKPLLANALIFPAVFILFLIIATILGLDDPWFVSKGLSGNFNQALPLFGGTPIGFGRAILAYGLLLAAPAVPDLIRDMIGAKMNQIISQEISKNMGTGQRGAALFGGTVGLAGYRFGGGLLEAGFRERAFGQALRDRGFRRGAGAQGGGR